MKTLVIPPWWMVGTKVRIRKYSFYEMVNAKRQFEADYGLPQWEFDPDMIRFTGFVTKIKELNGLNHPSCVLELCNYAWNMCWLEPVEAVPLQPAATRSQRCPLCGSPGDDLAFTFYCQKEGCRNFHP